MSYRHVIVDVCTKCLMTYEKGTAHQCGVIPEDGIDSLHIIDTFNRTVDQVDGMTTALQAQDMSCKERVQDALIRATNYTTQVDAAITESIGKLKQDVALSQFDIRGEIRAMNNRMDAIVSLVVTARDDIEAIQRDMINNSAPPTTSNQNDGLVTVAATPDQWKLVTQALSRWCANRSVPHSPERMGLVNDIFNRIKSANEAR